MRFIFLGILFLALVNCGSSFNYENFKERKGVDKIIFQGDFKECNKEGNLQALRSEGSKRSGEILMDKRRYSIACMKRKGWLLKDDL